MLDRSETSDASVMSEPVVEEKPPKTSPATRLWIRDSGVLGFDVTARVAWRSILSDTRFTVLVGAPGEPSPTVEAVVEAVRGLPEATQDNLVLTGYGIEQESGLSLAQRVADVLDQPIRTQHGIPTTDPDGTSHLTAIDAAGRPTWRPYVQLCTYRPGGIGVSVDRWVTPFPGAQLTSPGRYRLTVDWAIDVVPAGLIARPVTAPPNPLLCCAPTHPDRVDLVIDVPDGQRLPDEMLTALGRFGDSLAPGARSRLRLVLKEVPPLSARALKWAVPAPQVPWQAPDTGRPLPVVPPVDEVKLPVEVVPPIEVNLPIVLKARVALKAPVEEAAPGAGPTPAVPESPAGRGTKEPAPQRLGPSIPAARRATTLVVAQSGRLRLQ